VPTAASTAAAHGIGRYRIDLALPEAATSAEVDEGDVMRMLKARIRACRQHLDSLT
jgi:hypothetical protein